MLTTTFIFFIKIVERAYKNKKRRGIYTPHRSLGFVRALLNCRKKKNVCGQLESLVPRPKLYEFPLPRFPCPIRN